MSSWVGKMVLLFCLGLAGLAYVSAMSQLYVGFADLVRPSSKSSNSAGITGWPTRLQVISHPTAGWPRGPRKKKACKVPWTRSGTRTHSFCHILLTKCSQRASSDSKGRKYIAQLDGSSCTQSHHWGCRHRKVWKIRATFAINLPRVKKIRIF